MNNSETSKAQEETEHVKEVFEKDLRTERPNWQEAYELADKGLEKYRLTWKREFRGVRENLADIISLVLARRDKKIEELKKELSNFEPGRPGWRRIKEESL